MPSLFSRISKFAQSKQGRQLADQAVRVAKDPKTRRQVESVSRKLLGGKGKGKRPPAA
jgi:hypothetical protein